MRSGSCNYQILSHLQLQNNLVEMDFVSVFLRFGWYSEDHHIRQSWLTLYMTAGVLMMEVMTCGAHDIRAVGDAGEKLVRSSLQHKTSVSHQHAAADTLFTYS